MALSPPRANTTSPPFAFSAASGSLVSSPPTDSQFDHSPLRVTCQRCQMALSVPARSPMQEGFRTGPRDRFVAVTRSGCRPLVEGGLGRGGEWGVSRGPPERAGAPRCELLVEAEGVREAAQHPPRFGLRHAARVSGSAGGPARGGGDVSNPERGPDHGVEDPAPPALRHPPVQPPDILAVNERPAVLAIAHVLRRTCTGDRAAIRRQVRGARPRSAAKQMWMTCGSTVNQIRRV